VLVNEMPRYEILDEASMQELERGWRRIVSELGIDFLHDEAIAAFEAAGQKVEGQLVKFDPARVRPAGTQPGAHDPHRRQPHGLRRGLRLPLRS
jgi:trimethylamine---corrinoid protein Co-methyltransferase